MSDWPAHVDVREVGPRDGLQNEAPVPGRAAGAARSTRCRRPGCGSSRRRRSCRRPAIPPMAGAGEVMAAITRRPGVVYSALGAQSRRARSSPSPPGPDELELVVSASETHNQKNVRRSVAESLVGARCRRDRSRCGIVGRGDRVDRVRLPVRRRRRARAGRAGRRPPDRRGRRPAVVRRHDGHGDAAPRRRSPRRARPGGDHERPDRIALPQHARHRARQRRRRARPGRDPFRRRRSAGWADARTRRARRATR